MSSAQAPGAVRAVWIIARLALRRQLNLLMSFRFRRKSSGSGEARRLGTPSKSSGRSIVGAIVFFFMFVNGMFIGANAISGIYTASRNTVGHGDKIVVSFFTYRQLVDADDALREIRQDSDLAERGKYQDLWNRYVEGALSAETRLAPLTEAEERASLKEMRALFDKKGAAGFASAPRATFVVSAKIWPRSAAAGSAFVNSLGVLLLLWMPIMLGMSLATTNKDLGQVEWSLEWLYTFPASARALFASRLCTYSFLNPLVWCFLLPFIVQVYLAGGYGWAAVAMGLLVTIYLAILAGAMTLVLEVELRKTMNLSRLKNLQAAFTILGTVALLIFYAASFSGTAKAFLVHRAASIPSVWIWNPFSVPLVLGIPEATSWQLLAGVLEMIVVLGAVISFALLGCEWLTRDGLVRAGGPYQGLRGKSVARSRGGVLTGIAGVEVRLLTRDRNLLTQVIFIPLLLPGYYLIISPRMLSAMLGNFSHAALAVFAIGAYSFASSAIPLLDREGKTLWHLLSLPHSLVSIFLRMAMFWAIVGLLYGSVVLAIIIHFGAHLHLSAFGDALLALYGIALYAFIAAGLGILATDVLESERRARIRVSMVYLYLTLAAMYANIFYAPSAWTKFAQLVLSTLLAVALWQKVKDACPYLLDPTERPPRSISLADGMIAALSFFVVQGVGIVIMPHLSSAALSEQITIAYIVAGLSVASVVLLTFWRQGVPALWENLGLVRRDDEGHRLSVRQAVIQGAFWGGVAAFGAIVYLRALSLFPEWQVWKRNAELHSFLAPASQPILICILFVVAAPIFEEFLFRGLIFQGLRRTAGPILGVLGSAALFALVHPPIAVVPVFGLGIAAAISFNKSKYLLAPIVAHAVYNGSVLLLNRP
jgi:ABC-2 type transport system permease protein